MKHEIITLLNTESVERAQELLSGTRVIKASAAIAFAGTRPRATLVGKKMTGSYVCAVVLAVAISGTGVPPVQAHEKVFLPTQTEKPKIARPDSETASRTTQMRVCTHVFKHSKSLGLACVAARRGHRGLVGYFRTRGYKATAAYLEEGATKLTEVYRDVFWELEETGCPDR